VSTGAATPLVMVRIYENGDAERLVRMFNRLSPSSVYNRFFNPLPRLDGETLRRLTDVDHDRHEAAVALAGDEMVGLAQYFRNARDESSAEVAVVVEDAWQRMGIAKRLLRELARLGRERGICRLGAVVMLENRRALSLVRRMAPEAARERDGSTMLYEVSLPARAGDGYPPVVDVAPDVVVVSPSPLAKSAATTTSTLAPWRSSTGGSAGIACTVGAGSPSDAASAVASAS
jgi:GNAT superfamily N-acetyltransferase